MSKKPVGSRRVRADGYVNIKTAERQIRWPYEHRAVWEDANGPIPPGHHIHHRNGEKGDNRLENLELVDSNSTHHRSYHAGEHGRRVAKRNRAGRGVPKSPEHRAKIAAANKGKPKAPEQIAKSRAALLAKSPLPDPETVRMLYWDQGLSFEAIGSLYGCSTNSVWRFFDRHGIPRRKAWDRKIPGQAS